MRLTGGSLGDNLTSSPLARRGERWTMARRGLGLGLGPAGVHYNSRLSVSITSSQLAGPVF